MTVFPDRALNGERAFVRECSPLVLASALACTLLIARRYLFDSDEYRFMIWNLFLAWIPYLLSLLATAINAQYPRRLWLLLLPATLLWLIFFPNAPYLATDFIHLLELPSPALLYDVGLLLAFALAGIFLATASLRRMQGLTRQHLGAAASWFFVGLSSLLGGFGVYLGRYERHNSWDLLLHPAIVLADITALFHPLSDSRALGVTSIFAALLLVCYLQLASPHPPTPSPRHSGRGGAE